MQHTYKGNKKVTNALENEFVVEARFGLSSYKKTIQGLAFLDKIGHLTLELQRSPNK